MAQDASHALHAVIHGLALAQGAEAGSGAAAAAVHNQVMHGHVIFLDGEGDVIGAGVALGGVIEGTIALFLGLNFLDQHAGGQQLGAHFFIAVGGGVQAGSGQRIRHGSL